jgi:hypothetical protein
VGFFGTYLFEGGQWTEAEGARRAGEPWLFVNIYDSVIATVMYHPSDPGMGMAFLGATPRTYFDDATASAPTDVGLESLGLANWWAHRARAGEPARDDKQTELMDYLADDDIIERRDAVVEDTVVRFLATLDLPPPADLAR